MTVQRVITICPQETYTAWEPINLNESEEVITVGARNAPNGQESAVLDNMQKAFAEAP